MKPVAELLPVFIVELETGELYIHHTVGDLRVHVEEFWDVLDQDFAAFSWHGSRLHFDPNFLQGDELAVCLAPWVGFIIFSRVAANGAP